MVSSTNPCPLAEVVPSTLMPFEAPMEPPNIDINKLHSTLKPKSFSKIVTHSAANICAGTKFLFANPNGKGGSGKASDTSLQSFSISPNSDMLNEIVKEKNRLKDCYFFCCS